MSWFSKGSAPAKADLMTLLNKPVATIAAIVAADLPTVLSDLDKVRKSFEALRDFKNAEVASLEAVIATHTVLRDAAVAVSKQADAMAAAVVGVIPVAPVAPVVAPVVAAVTPVAATPTA